MRKKRLKELLLKLRLIHKKKRPVMATAKELNQTNHYLENQEHFIFTKLMAFIIA